MPLLFSYGTLQLGDVQMSLFGRLMEGTSDELVGFEQGVVAVSDSDFATESGTVEHAIVRFTGEPTDRVGGMVFELSSEELSRADEYEPEEYERFFLKLASGRKSWVYAERKL